MRSRGSLGAPLLLALLLYSAWSPFAFVSSPPPRSRKAVPCGASGDDHRLRSLLLSDSSSKGAKASKKAEAPAAKKKEAPKAEKPAPSKDEEKAPAAKDEKKVGAAKTEEEGLASQTKEVAGLNILRKDDEGLFRFVKVDREDALHAAFDSFDINGDGTLSREELFGAAIKFGESLEQTDQLLKQFDDNGDGDIDFDEFKQMISKVEEGCDVEKEQCFSLRKPSTWGLLFRRRKS